MSLRAMKWPSNKTGENKTMTRSLFRWLIGLAMCFLVLVSLAGCPLDWLYRQGNIENTLDELKRVAKQCGATDAHIQATFDAIWWITKTLSGGRNYTRYTPTPTDTGQPELPGCAVGSAFKQKTVSRPLLQLCQIQRQRGTV